MTAEAFTDVERRFLEELEARGVRYLVVGMTAAVLQGARGVTEGIDLWFERLDDPAIAELRARWWALRQRNVRYAPAELGGALGDRFDVVTTVDGAEPFAVESARAIQIVVSGVRLPVMPLARVVASKRASGRKKDLAQLPALEEALMVLQADDDVKRNEPE